MNSRSGDRGVFATEVRAALGTGGWSRVVSSGGVMVTFVGATRGARVGGTCIGGLAIAAIAVGAWGTANWWPAVPALVPFLFMVIRPWFLWVRVSAEGFDVRSWFRRYSFARGTVVAIELVPYHGMVAISEIGWLPFAGTIRMLEVVTIDGRSRSLPCTVGRWNRTLRLARSLRAAVGLVSG